jgi:hypothetical protein
LKKQISQANSSQKKEDYASTKKTVTKKKNKVRRKGNIHIFAALKTRVKRKLIN